MDKTNTNVEILVPDVINYQDLERRFSSTRNLMLSMIKQFREIHGDLEKLTVTWSDGQTKLQEGGKMRCFLWRLVFGDRVAKKMHRDLEQILSEITRQVGFLNQYLEISESALSKISQRSLNRDEAINLFDTSRLVYTEAKKCRLSLEIAWKWHAALEHRTKYNLVGCLIR